MVVEPGKSAERDWQVRAAIGRIVYLIAIAFSLALLKGFFSGMAKHNPLLLVPIPDFVPSIFITMLIPAGIALAQPLPVDVQSHRSGNLSYFLFFLKRPVRRSFVMRTLFLVLWGAFFLMHAPLFAFETIVSRLTRSDAR